jgi:hypothetical protein
MIYDHSYKPNPKFYRGGRGTEALFFGFELEIETEACPKTREELSEDVKSLAPFCYCKRDGSLSCGFEVVSHPMSWKWIKRNKAKLLKLLGHLDKAGAKSYDTTTCGLHVHVSKAGLGRSVLESMLKFVFGNPEFVHKLSRRTKSSLDQWAKAELSGSSKDEALSPDSSNKPRRLALNTLPENTAEFRMFRGTLSAKGFMRALEFCHSLVECIRRKQGDVSLDEYDGFVRGEMEEYPNLAKFLSRHWVGSSPAVSTASESPRRLSDRAANVENPGLPTASQLSENTLLEIRRSRNTGMTWAWIEEHYNLRRANGMTAYHAFERAGRLPSVAYERAMDAAVEAERSAVAAGA